MSSKYTELYSAETRELLATITQALLALERSPGEREHVDALFRAFHTVKGMSAAMGFDGVASLAHEAETVLDLVRRGVAPASPALVDALLGAGDALERAVDRALRGEPGGADVDAVRDRLRTIGAAADAPHALNATDPHLVAIFTPAELPAIDGTRVRVRLEEQTPLPGVRALVVVQRLRALGEVVDIDPSADALRQGRFDREFSVRLQTQASQEQIESAVRSAGFVHEVSIDRATVSARPTPMAMPAIPAAPSQPPALTPRTSAGAGAAPGGRHVRVDLARLDTLTNLMGELVIARGRLAQIAARIGDPELDEAILDASRLIGDVRDGLMRSRMAPVWQVFSRFPRFVRDAARTLGKDVDLAVGGQDIELDRSMLDELSEPLIHLLRNAVDHGIEMPNERVAKGKPAAGRIVVEAARDREFVVVRVSDDGRGIDRSAVLGRARDLGIVTDGGRDLSDEDVFKLIARPGFSTAHEVTALSGRGVGIDAVQTRVRALGGTMEMRPRSGGGTIVTLRLPVTLAIVRAVLLRAGDESYALPVAHVTETMRRATAPVSQVEGRAVMVRGASVMPVLDLRTILGLPARDETGGQIVVLEAGERRAGLIVDALVGQQDIVVKSFDNVRGGASCFSGATILGDGMPALILDASTLV
jgi:two-component system, chemotaxis family, sensor kinase CheA